MADFTELVRYLEMKDGAASIEAENLVQLLTTDDPDKEQELLQASDRVRHRNVGDAVHLRGLIEFSNICIRDCCYCGIRSHHSTVKRYRMSPKQIIDTARTAISLGYKTLVLQSGEDPYFTVRVIADIICAIKDQADIAITLSVGERLTQDYRIWREAGADRYLMRFETSNPELYAALHPGMSYSERFRCLYDLKALGYQLGSGFLIGLPGQSALDIARDLLKLKELDVDMAGIGPFLPAPGTPLSGALPPSSRLCYRTIAAARLLLPQAHLPATTAIGTLEEAGRITALRVGANVVMPNVTPQPFRSQYQLYPNKICLDDTAHHCRGCIEAQIAAIGRTIGTGLGHGLKYQTRQRD